MHENNFQLLKHAIENMMPANKIHCLKIVEIVEISSNNMDIIMPSIAVLLAMRDKNFDGTMKALHFLKHS